MNQAWVAGGLPGPNSAVPVFPATGGPPGTWAGVPVPEATTSAISWRRVCTTPGSSGGGMAVDAVVPGAAPPVAAEAPVPVPAPAVLPTRRGACQEPASTAAA